jgi:hypothetical protein
MRTRDYDDNGIPDFEDYRDWDRNDFYFIGGYGRHHFPSSTAQRMKVSAAMTLLDEIRIKANSMVLDRDYNGDLGVRYTDGKQAWFYKPLYPEITIARTKRLYMKLSTELGEHIEKLRVKHNSEFAFLRQPSSSLTLDAV